LPSAASSGRRGALLLAALLALNLFLPTLHALASQNGAGSPASHHSEQCAQCKDFAHSRTDFVPSAAPAPAALTPGDRAQPPAPAPILFAETHPGIASPRAPPFATAPV
jgi:hypothetical protein